MGGAGRLLRFNCRNGMYGLRNLFHFFLFSIVLLFLLLLLFCFPIPSRTAAEFIRTVKRRKKQSDQFRWMNPDWAQGTLHLTQSR